MVRPDDTNRDEIRGGAAVARVVSAAGCDNTMPAALPG